MGRHSAPKRRVGVFVFVFVSHCVRRTPWLASSSPPVWWSRIYRVKVKKKKKVFYLAGVDRRVESIAHFIS